MNRQIGWSTESNLLWQIGNQIDRMTGVIGSTLSTFVPQSRTLTINGVTYDLSANRSWTVAAGLSGTIATGQVAFGSALNTISGSNNFLFDNTTGFLELYSQDVDTIQIGRKSTITQFSQQNGILFGSFVSGVFRDTSEIRSYYTGNGSQRAGKLVVATRNTTGGLSTINFGENGQIYTFGANVPNTYPSKLFVAGIGLTAATYTAQFHNGTGGNNALLIDDTGSVLLGSSVSNGQRFQVYGDSYIKGSGTTSATTALSIQDNLANTILRVRNDNRVFVNQLGFGNDFPEIVSTSTGTYDINGASLSFIASQANYGLATYNVYFRHVYAGRVNTSGTSGGILQNLNFNPTSGTGIFNHLTLSGIINQTGGANGISRGLYISPTITAAADWRSIEWSNNTGWGLYGAGTAPNYLGGDLTVVGVFRETVTTNRQTASYSLVLLDRGKLVEMNVASANNLTVPLDSAIAFPVGTKIDISQYGAGQTTVVATGGVTVRSAGGALKLAAQYSGATLVKIATNEWYLFGDITT